MRTDRMAYVLGLVEERIRADLAREKELRARLSEPVDSSDERAWRRRAQSEYDCLIEQRNMTTVDLDVSPEKLLGKVAALRKQFAGAPDTVRRDGGRAYSLTFQIPFESWPRCPKCGEYDHSDCGNETLVRKPEDIDADRPLPRKPPWWAGKDVAGWLYKEGWRVTVGGMALCLAGGIRPWSAFIPEQWIIDSNQSPGVDGPNLVARARAALLADLSERKDAPEENTSQHEGGDPQEAPSGSRGAGDHGDDPAR